MPSCHRKNCGPSKSAVEKKQETSAPSPAFVPATDIFQIDAALTIVMEMPDSEKQPRHQRRGRDFGPASISTSTRACSQSIPSTTSAITGPASSLQQGRAKPNERPDERQRLDLVPPRPSPAGSQCLERLGLATGGTWSARQSSRAPLVVQRGRRLSGGASGSELLCPPPGVPTTAVAAPSLCG